MKFSNGDLVEILPSFGCGVVIPRGEYGVIRGIAVGEQPVVGYLMIVEIHIPNHPWDCIAVPEIHLQKVMAS